MAEFNLIWATTVAFLSSFIPGFLLAYPLLRKTSLRLFEIVIFGFVIGVVLPPALLFFESLAGVGFSLGLVYANIALISVIGLVMIFREGMPKGTLTFATNLDHISGKIDLFEKKNLLILSLILIFLFAYWVRIIGFQANPYSNNPDPYSYLVTTRFIINDGSVPIKDDLAWFPNSVMHRERPLMQYMLASWYSIYTGGSDADFDRLLLLKLSDVYPALFGALGCLLLFILLSRFVDERFAVFGAALGTLLPITVITVSWGPEQVPWALLSMLAFFASYALYNKETRWEFVALSALIMLGVSLGSKGDIFVYSVFAVYVVLQGTLLLISGRLDWGFAFHNILIGGVAVVSILVYYFRYKPEGLLSVGIVTLALAYLILITLFHGRIPMLGKENVLTVIMGLIILSSLAYLSPLGFILKDYIRTVSSQSTLFSTIAEHQTISPGEYAVALGPLGMQAGDLKTLDLVMVLFVLLVAFDFAYRSTKSSIFIAIIVLPIYLLFSYNLKFISYLGPITAIAVAFCVGGVYGLANEMMREVKKEKQSVFIGVSQAMTLLSQLLVIALALFMIFDVSPFLFTSTTDLALRCQQPDIAEHQVSQKIFCNKIPTEWVNALDWIHENTRKDDAILAWWDYGHWINYLGERRVVIRNDLAYQDMVQDTAYLLQSNDTRQLIDFMQIGKNNETRARYLLLDQELVGKWTAISYLNCLKEGKTNGPFSTYSEERSTCEKNLDFELFQDPRSITLSDYCTGEKQTHFRAVTNKDNVYCVPTKIQQSADVFDKSMENPLNVTFFVMNVARGNTFTQAYLFLYQEKEAKKFDGPYTSIFYTGWRLGGIQGFDRIYGGPQGDVPNQIALYELK